MIAPGWEGDHGPGDSRFLHSGVTNFAYPTTTTHATTSLEVGIRTVRCAYNNRLDMAQICEDLVERFFVHLNWRLKAFVLKKNA